VDANQAQLLREIQQLEFVAIELTLYLDTHPDEPEPLKEYNRTTEQLNQLKMQYERLYGPLASFGVSTSRSPWQWAEEPWPWDIN
jgi:spore coat protein JB